MLNSPTIYEEILICGDWSSDYQEESICKGFERLGYGVTKFKTSVYFLSRRNFICQFLMRIQRRLLLGPLIWKINLDLYKAVCALQPKALFLYRNTQIYPQTLIWIKRRCRTVIVSYNNDNAFSKSASSVDWRLFVRSLCYVDLALAFRESNLSDFKRAGARRVALLGTWFDPDRHYLRWLTENELSSYACDVVFVGHYEDDGRLDYLEEVVKLGLKLRIFGPGYEWNSVLSESPVLRHLVPTQMVWGEEYPKAISGAKVALCFFSKLNEDHVTTRVFEIPACGTLLFSEQSSKVGELYAIGEEALMFDSRKSFRSALSKIFSDACSSSRLSLAGQRRAWSSGYDVYSKAQLVDDLITKIKYEQFI
jgi:spore maturation protein CgeB